MPPYRNREGGGGPTDLMDTDISFPLQRLFDPYNLDHIPVKKRMDEFEHRDLAHIKHYKAAVKIFGGPLSRKRVIVAPPMETPMKHRLGLYINKRETPPPPQLNTNLNPQIPPEKPPPEELVLAREAQEREDKYKAWFKERQKFRNDLENMGLNLEYMKNKPNKSVLEKRVLRQLEIERNKDLASKEVVIIETPEPSRKTTSPDSESSELPGLKIPAPLGLLILEKHIKEQKLRLIDLFRQVDKNKDWKISREEFINSCEEKNIPISRAILEDMLITLDMNMDDLLDYKEMARGMEMTRRQIRDDKRKLLSRESTSVSQKSGKSQGSDTKSTDGSAPLINLIPEYLSQKSQSSKTDPLSLKQADLSTSSRSKPMSDQASKKSEMSKASSRMSAGSKGTARSEVMTGGAMSSSKSERNGSPNLLTPPETDIRKEQLVLDSEEAMLDLRKRNRENLKGFNSKESSKEKISIKEETEPKTLPIKEESAPKTLEIIEEKVPQTLPIEEEKVTQTLQIKEEKVPKKVSDPGPSWPSCNINKKHLSVPPQTIRTGNKAIDDHCQRSTLVGDVGEMVDKFRQKRLQEFYEVSKLCDKNGVVLSQKLLEKVLLYPPDRPHTEQQRFRPPDSAPLVSSHFADRPKRPRTPIEVKHKDKVRRSKSGKLLIDSRHQYPMAKHVAAEGSKHNLSTGRTVIRRKVDCWMTFEDYEKLTRHYAIRYQHLHGTTNENAFWPGHLLDKVRLCMPPYDKASVRDKEKAIYVNVRRTPAVNYGYDPVDVWQTNDNMYTQIGIHDHFKNKTII